MVYANGIFFTQNWRFYRFPSEFTFAIQLMKERKHPHERSLLCHVKNAKMKIYHQMLQPQLLWEPVWKIGNYKSCKYLQTKSIQITHLHTMSIPGIGTKKTKSLLFEDLIVTILLAQVILCLFLTPMNKVIILWLDCKGFFKFVVVAFAFLL